MAAAAAASGADPIGVTAFMALCAPLASLAHSRPPPLRSARRREDELPRTAAYDDLSHGSVRFGQPALAFT